MSRGRAIEAGQAAVRFIGDRGPLQRALRLAEHDLRAFGTTVNNIGKSLTIAAVATGAAFAVPVRDALRLQEALSGLDAAFGKEAKNARDFLDELRKELKLSQQSAAEALTGFQRFFRGMGFGEKEAAKLSENMSKIAADLSAAGDISFDEAAGRIRSALTGSTTVLDQFGINLKESAIESEALSRGIKKTTGDLDSYERAVINASLITKQFASNGILGAAKREADSASGQVRALKGQMADLSATIGGVLIPVIQPAVKGLQEAAEATSAWVVENQGLVRDAAKAIVVIGAFGVAMQAASFPVYGLAKAIAAVRVAMNFLTAHPIAAIALAIAGVTASLVAQSKSWDEWKSVANAAIQGVGSKLKGLALQFDKFLGLAPTESELPVPQPVDNRTTALQKESLANAKIRAATEEEILLTRKRQAEALQSLPDHVLEGYGLSHIERGMVDTVKVIGSSLKKDFGAVSDMLKAELGIAKELGDTLVQGGQKFFEQHQLGILERQFAKLQQTTFRFEIATSFRHGALREAFGIGSERVEDEQLEVQKEMAALLRQIEAKKALIGVM